MSGGTRDKMCTYSWIFHCHLLRISLFLNEFYYLSHMGLQTIGDCTTKLTVNHYVGVCSTKVSYYLSRCVIYGYYFVIYELSLRNIVNVFFLISNNTSEWILLWQLNVLIEFHIWRHSTERFRCFLNDELSLLELLLNRRMIYIQLSYILKIPWTVPEVMCVVKFSEKR